MSGCLQFFEVNGLEPANRRQFRAWQGQKGTLQFVADAAIINRSGCIAKASLRKGKQQCDHNQYQRTTQCSPALNLDSPKLDEALDQKHDTGNAQKVHTGEPGLSPPI